MRRRAGSLVAVACVLVAVGVGALPAPAAGADTYTLLVSSSADRSSAVPLDGQELSGHVYVFTSPDTGVTGVIFWVDDPDRSGAPARRESSAPYDLAGGAPGGDANPYDTARLGDGEHSVTAELVTSSGTFVITSTFTVRNTSAPPPPPQEPGAPSQIHLSWTGDSSRSMTVVWHTAGTSGTASASTVQWRPVGSTAWQQATGSLRASGTDTGTLRLAAITGLLPGAAYEYRVPGDGGVWSPVHSFRTAPTDGERVDVVYFADTGLIGRADGLSSGTEAVRDLIAGQRPLLALGGGDYAYYNTDKRYGSLDNSIDAWFRQVEPIAAASALMPTYGNHEILLEEDFTDWAPRFATPSGWNSRRAYSFDVSGVHLVSILAVKGGRPLPRGQMDWLRKDLAAATAAGKPILPFFHVSTFTDGTSHKSNLDMRSQLGPLFEQHGVRVVLMSHDQSYNRTWPLAGVGTANMRSTSSSRSCYTAADGTTWLTVSPAGKESNISGGFSKWSSSTPSWWSVRRDNTQHHWVRLQIDDAGRVDAQVFGLPPGETTASVIDSFRYADSCP